MRDYYYDGKNRISEIRKMHEKINSGNVDDITWSDLEMDEVFLDMNYAESFLGEQYLYHALHCDEKEEISEDLVEDFCDKEGLRSEIKNKIRKIGKRTESYYLYELLKDSDLLLISNGAIIYLLQIIFVSLGIACLITKSDVLIAALFISVATNIFVYLLTKRKYEIYLNTIISFKEIYTVAGYLIKKKEMGNHVFQEEKRAYENLKGMNKILAGIVSRKRASMAADIGGMVLDYIYGILLYDIAIYNLIMKGISKKEKDVLALLKLIGRVDGALAVAVYKEKLPLWTKAEITEGEFEVEGLVHPLLLDGVSNDLAINEKIIITGPNAAGKSTFMKAVAINEILAQSIHICTATSFRTPKLKVMTCMALRDDVTSGESYYFREANYIKRILDRVAGEGDLLIVIDEILKGTNTKERIAASKAILEYLVSKNVYLMVATHDLELTKIDGYINYHFDSKILDDEIVFDYKIHEGVSGSKNAIALLEYLKYPTEIIKTARDYVDEDRRSV